MRNWLQATGIFFLLGLTPAHANEQPSDFFERYAEYVKTFNRAVIQLYSNDALIHAYRVYPNKRTEKHMEFNGENWKRYLKQAMPFASLENETNTFSNVTVSEYNNGYIIKAHRYSIKKCYTDKNYYMVINPDIYGSYEIIEEYMEVDPTARCQ